MPHNDGELQNLREAPDNSQLLHYYYCFCHLMSIKFGSIPSAVADKTSEWSDMSLFSQDGHNFAPVLPPLHKQQRLIFYLYECLSSDTYCQDLARMSHHFLNQMLPHQSNLHSLSPVISFRFKGCNLKHEWRRFPDVCFSSLVIKIIYFQVFEYIMRNIKDAENVCDSHSFPVYNIFSPCQHDMMLLFLKKPNSTLIRRMHVLPEHTMPERVNIFLPEVQVHSN